MIEFEENKGYSSIYERYNYYIPTTFYSFVHKKYDMLNKNDGRV